MRGAQCVSVLAAQRTAAEVVPISSRLLSQLRQAASNGAVAPQPAVFTPLRSPAQEGASAHKQHEATNSDPAGALGNGQVVQQSDVQRQPGSELSLATRLTHPEFWNDDPYNATAPPMYQTSTFRQLSAVDCGPYDYTRSGNPTRTQLERQMAEIEVRFLKKTAILLAQMMFSWKFELCAAGFMV